MARLAICERVRDEFGEALRRRRRRGALATEWLREDRDRR
jgi:hypothetical protein